jgi:hypothetical protein
MKAQPFALAWLWLVDLAGSRFGIRVASKFPQVFPANAHDARLRHLIP